MKVSDFLVMSLKSHARACQTIISLKTDLWLYTRIKPEVSKFNLTGGLTVVELNLLKGCAPQIFDWFAPEFTW